MMWRTASCLCVLAVLSLAGCTETELVIDQSKTIEDSGPDGPVAYKIGDPYQIDGVWYYPKVDYAYDQTGIASWYGPGFDGKATANGETYDQNALTAAHNTLPLPTLVRVTNLENGRAIELRINDRGPFAHGRIIDVSRRAAQLLGFETAGTARVRVEVLEEESRILAERLSDQPGSDVVLPPAPAAAPSIAVTSAPLPDTGGGAVAAPAATATLPAPATTASSVSVPPYEPSTTTVYQHSVTATEIFIQAGAFVDIQNAERLRQQLSGLGPTELYPVLVGNQRYYRVRMGPIPTVTQADALLERVIAQGHQEARIVVD
jgi:rare lipoprotein A